MRPTASFHTWPGMIAMALLAIAASASSVVAQRLTLSISEPAAADVEVHRSITANRWLEPIRAHLSAFKLKRPVAVEVKSCSDSGFAWYEEDTIIVCYRYIANVERNARHAERPAWLTEDEAIAGGVVDVFFHEFAHALMDQHGIPVLGREEDAADQIAAFMMLSRSPAEAGALLRGTAYTYLRWHRDYGDGQRHNRVLRSGARSFAAEPHGSFAQRFYNIVCLAHGSDAGRFAGMVRDADLPDARAEGCGDELTLVENAWRRLIAPLIDRNAMAQAAKQDLVAPFRKAGG